MIKIQDKKASITYLMKENLTNYYKIGKSDNIKSRLSSLRTGNIHIELVGISEEGEYTLHEEFSNLRIQGEWFDFSKSPKKEKKLLSYFVNYTKENEKSIVDKVEILRPHQVKYKINTDPRWIDIYTLDRWRQERKEKAARKKASEEKHPDDLKQWEVERNERYHQAMKHGGFSRSYSAYK